MIKTKKLPGKPSELIRLALDDLRKCERSPKYRINMGTWHDANGQCTVCFAGAVMAQSLGADHLRDSLPNQFKSSEDALLALDAFQRGGISEAMGYLGWDGEEWEAMDRRVVSYCDDRQEFHRQMRKLARELVAEGC